MSDILRYIQFRSLVRYASSCLDSCLWAHLNLLETRRLVLQQAGFQAWTVLSLDEAEKITATQPDVLFIMCYSLTIKECEQALAMVHSRNPGRKSLVLAAGAEVSEQGEDDELLSAFDGPRALLAAVDRLLKGQQSTRKADRPNPPSTRQLQTAY